MTKDKTQQCEVKIKVVEDIVFELLSQKADVAAKSLNGKGKMTASSWAARAKNKRVQIMLTEASLASCRGDTHINKDLLKRHIDQTATTEQSSLSQEQKDQEYAELVDTDAQTREEWEDMMRLGFAPSRIDQVAGDGGTQAIHAAAREGYVRALEWLIAQKANIEATDATGKTPLLRGAERGQAAALDMLIKAGAHVDAQDADSNTALILAAGGSSVEVVEKLLEAEADISLTTDPILGGLDACGIAEQSRNREIMSILQAQKQNAQETSERISPGQCVSYVRWVRVLGTLETIMVLWSVLWIQNPQLHLVPVDFRTVFF